MEDIKVNEYVRTNEGYISKFINYGKNEGINGKSALFDSAIRDISSLVYDKDDFLFDSELKKYIVKHSPNITDLIEVGDYVNGYKVSFVDEEPVMGKFVQCDYEVSFGTTTHYRFYEADTKSIVTKEQFENVEYKLGE